MGEKTLTQRAIQRLVERGDHSADEMFAIVSEIMDGRASEAQIGAFLVALRMKSETVEEITGAVRAMREHARKVQVADGIVFDTCGTGGDSAGTFNVSTATAFVVAGAGIRVAKHGNRSVSSRCGSADVLASLGVDLELAPERVAEAIDGVGIAFLFAPLYHGAMKHAAVPRREIAVRSIFNILGPLSNPAGATHQLVGVYDAAMVEPLAHVLRNLGTRGAMVVHGADGLDELTLTGETKVAELRNGEISTYTLDPRELGFSLVTLDDLRGGDAEDNARLLRDVLSGKPSAMTEMTVLNAAAALRICDAAADWSSAVARARESLSSGAALARLDALVAFCRGGSVPA